MMQGRGRFIAALFLLACGGPVRPGGTGGGESGAGGGTATPRAGDPCTGDWVCTSSTDLLACEPRDAGSTVFGTTAKFVAYSCKGPNGCIGNSSRTVCDFTGADPGDPCPELEVGKGFCRGDGGLLRCDFDGGWHVLTCPSCREQSGSILCN